MLFFHNSFQDQAKIDSIELKVLTYTVLLFVFSAVCPKLIADTPLFTCFFYSLNVCRAAQRYG